MQPAAMTFARAPLRVLFASRPVLPLALLFPVLHATPLAQTTLAALLVTALAAFLATSAARPRPAATTSRAGLAFLAGAAALLAGMVEPGAVWSVALLVLLARLEAVVARSPLLLREAVPFCADLVLLDLGLRVLGLPPGLDLLLLVAGRRLLASGAAATLAARAEAARATRLRRLRRARFLELAGWLALIVALAMLLTLAAPATLTAAAVFCLLTARGPVRRGGSRAWGLLLAACGGFGRAPHRT